MSDLWNADRLEQKGFAVFNRTAIVAILILVPHYLGPWTNYLKSSRDVDECGSKGGECWVGLDVGI